METSLSPALRSCFARAVAWRAQLKGQGDCRLPPTRPLPLLCTPQPTQTAAAPAAAPLSTAFGLTSLRLPGTRVRAALCATPAALHATPAALRATPANEPQRLSTRYHAPSAARRRNGHGDRRDVYLERRDESPHRIFGAPRAAWPRGQARPRDHGQLRRAPPFACSGLHLLRPFTHAAAPSRAATCRLAPSHLVPVAHLSLTWHAPLPYRPAHCRARAARSRPVERLPRRDARRGDIKSGELAATHGARPDRSRTESVRRGDEHRRRQHGERWARWRRRRHGRAGGASGRGHVANDRGAHGRVWRNARRGEKGIALPRSHVDTGVQCSPPTSFPCRRWARCCKNGRSCS